MPIVKFTLTVFLITISIVASAAPQSDLSTCEAVRDARKRLACYDKVAKQTKSSADAEAAQQHAEAERLAKEKEQALAVEKAKALDAANVALKALRRFESRISAGISYRDYSAPLGEAEFEVREFIQSSAGKMLPDVVEALNKAVEHYMFAHDVWSVKFTGRGRAFEGMSRFEAPNIYDKLTGTYSLSPHRDAGILYTAALPVIWIYASTEIARANLILKAGGAIPQPALIHTKQDEAQPRSGTDETQ